MFLLTFFAITGATNTAFADVLPLPEPATSARFEEGQVWTYKTRENETRSRVIIGKIERFPTIGIVIHVKLIGLRKKNPAAAGRYGSVAQHLPVSEEALSKNTILLTKKAGDLSGFLGGYNTWLSAYQNNDAGVFSITLAEIVDVLEQAINQ